MQLVQPASPGLPAGTYHWRDLNIEVCLAIFDFSLGGRQSPGKSDVERHIGGHAPIILDEWAE